MSNPHRQAALAKYTRRLDSIEPSSIDHEYEKGVAEDITIEWAVGQILADPDLMLEAVCEASPKAAVKELFTALHNGGVWREHEIQRALDNIAHAYAGEYLEIIGR